MNQNTQAKDLQDEISKMQSTINSCHTEINFYKTEAASQALKVMEANAAATHREKAFDAHANKLSVEIEGLKSQLQASEKNVMKGRKEILKQAEKMRKTKAKKK